MSKLQHFSTDEIDCLQELINISYGNATAAISTILDSFATLNIPHIDILDLDKSSYYFEKNFPKDKTYFLATQLIDGDLGGEILFIINHDSCISLAHEFDLEDDEICDEELSDIVLETTNILSSSMIGKLAQQMDTVVSFSPPKVEKSNNINIFKNEHALGYNQIIIIHTELLFNDKKIKGDILLLSKDEKICWIKQAINKFLEEF
jgi:chemotaxis protein CheC